MKKIKVFIIIDHLGAGGAQRQVIEFLKHADRDRLDLKVINLDKDYAPVANEIEELGIKIIGIKHSGFFNLNTLNTLVSLFKNDMPDIVHTYLFTADCYGRLAAKIAGIKTIICAIRADDIWKKWHHILADRILANFTDVITINAQGLKSYLIDIEKINPKKIVTIYNGIDVGRFTNLKAAADMRKNLNIPQDALVIGMAGRISNQKDHKTFLQAAKQVCEKIPQAYFLVAGDGPLKQDLESQAENKIKFLGHRTDMPDVINAIDIGVLSSHYEGCPNVILEYMACSKPVIASDVGGCKELVIEGKTGFIVPPKSPNVLAEKLLVLLKDKQLRQNMGAAGRTRVEENFTSKKMADNIERLYRELIKPKIAFIFSQFPCYDETFILREMNQLKATGLSFDIYSLKTPKDKIIHDEAVDLTKDTAYLPFFSIKLLFINLFFLIRHPDRFLAAFFQALFFNFKNPDFTFKTCALWYKAVGFAWLARKNKISHIHGQWATFPATVAFIIHKLNNTPFSFTGHAHDIYVSTAGLKEKMKAAKFILTCTANNKQYLLKLADNSFPENKIIVNYHGVDIERFNKDNSSQPHTNHKPFQILSVGSLLHCKGFDILIEACGILEKKGLSFECIIAGGGPLENKLKSIVSERRLNDKVKFTGYITQERLIPLYQNADILALPVRLGIHWGIPNVLLEAMAAKIPVICSNLPSIPELIVDQKTGFITEEENPQALADILLKISSDVRLKEQIGNAGYNVIDINFNVKRNSAKLTELFQKQNV